MAVGASSEGWIADSVSMSNVECGIVSPPSQPLADVDVLVAKQHGGASTAVPVGADGQYRIAVGPGVFRLRFRHAKEQIVRENVVVRVANTTPVFVTFKPSPADCAARTQISS